MSSTEGDPRPPVPGSAADPRVQAPGPAADPGEGGGAPSYRPMSAEVLLRQAIQMIEQARPMPLSASSMINKEEILPVLQQALAGLPEELRAARWMVKEREAYRSRMEREGEDIMAAARARAEQMVQRTEVMKAAEHRARRIVAEAEERARRMKLETEDWCDQKLGGFEAVLQKTLRSVASGRERLQGVAARSAPEPEPEPELADSEDVFDQDSD